MSLTMKRGLTWSDWSDEVLAHPCMPEGLNDLFARFGDYQLADQLLDLLILDLATMWDCLDVPLC